LAGAGHDLLREFLPGQPAGVGKVVRVEKPHRNPGRGGEAERDGAKCRRQIRGRRGPTRLIDPDGTVMSGALEHRPGEVLAIGADEALLRGTERFKAAALTAQRQKSE